MNSRIKSFVSFLLPLFTLFACHNVNNVQIEDEDYTSGDYPITVTKSGFKKVPYGSEYAISYDETGIIKNATSGIVKDVVIELRIVIKLDNGNEITNKQIDPQPIILDSYQDYLKGQLLPNNEKRYKLSSLRLTKEYISYPLNKFYIQCVIKGTDPLKGDERFLEVIEQKDVTEEWKKFVKSFSPVEYNESSSANVENIVSTSKRYCNELLEGSFYNVTIQGDTLTFFYKYKDFEETVNGKVRDGKIYTNDRLERENKGMGGNVYFLTSDSLKVFNPEGGYTVFKLCK